MKSGLSLVRVSTTNQEDNTSLESQEEANENYCIQNGILIKDICRIVHSGADIFNAPEFLPFLPQIKSGEYDAIIVYEIDRFSRDIEQAYALKYLFKTHNVELHYVKESFNQSPEGKLIEFIKLFYAEKEHAKIRERMMRAKLHKLEKGEWMPSADLYGYRYNRETKKREIVEEEAEIIRELFARLIKGDSLNSIYKDFNKRNIPAPSQSRRKEGKDNTKIYFWHRTALRRIRDDIQYTGKTIAHRKQTITFYEQGKKKVKLIDLPQSEWIELPEGITPPIIDLDTYSLANKISKAQAGDNLRNEKEFFLFRGRVFCAVCGLKMYVEKATNKRKIYRCSSRSNYSKSKCTGKATNAKFIDIPVWLAIRSVIKNPHKIQQQCRALTKMRNKKEVKEKRSVEINKLLTRLEQEINVLANRAATASDEVWQSLEYQIKERQAEKQKLINELSRFSEDAEKQSDKLNDLLSFIGKVQDRIEKADDNLKLLIIRAFDVKIFADGRKIEPVWDFF